jgi:hypothetical protein
MHSLFITPFVGSPEKIYFSVMKFSPGQQVMVLDTTQKPAGSAIVQSYHPEEHRCIVLFLYPGTTVPESIPVPEYRLVSHPLLAAIQE